MKKVVTKIAKVVDKFAVLPLSETYNSNMSVRHSPVNPPQKPGSQPPLPEQPDQDDEELVEIEKRAADFAKKAYEDTLKKFEEQDQAEKMNVGAGAFRPISEVPKIVETDEHGNAIKDDVHDLEEQLAQVVNQCMDLKTRIAAQQEYSGKTFEEVVSEVVEKRHMQDPSGKLLKPKLITVTPVESEKDLDKKEAVSDAVDHRKEYQNRSKHLNPLSQQLQRTYVNAMSVFQADSGEAISHEYGAFLVNEVIKAYNELARLREWVLEPLSEAEIQEKKIVDYLDQKYAMLVSVRKEFDRYFLDLKKSTENEVKKSYLQEELKRVQAKKLAYQRQLDEEKEKAIELQRLAAKKQQEKMKKEEEEQAAEQEDLLERLKNLSKKKSKSFEDQFNFPPPPMQTPVPESLKSWDTPSRSEAGTPVATPAPTPGPASNTAFAKCSLCNGFFPADDMSEHVMATHGAGANLAVADKGGNDQGLAKVADQLRLANFRIRENVHVFKGEREHYPTWRSRWNHAKRIMDEMNMSSIDQYYKLQDVLGQRPSSLVYEPTPTKETLSFALSTLDQMYGDAQLYLRDVSRSIFNLKPMKDNVVSLEDGLAELKKSYAKLKQKNMSEKELFLLLFVLQTEDKLSKVSFQEWIKIKRGKKDDASALGANVVIEDYWNAISYALDNARHLEKPSGDDGDRQDGGGGGKPGNHKQKSSFYGSHSVALNDDKKCIFCEKKAHPKQIECGLLPTLSKSKIYRIMSKFGVECQKCLELGHRSPNCPSGLADCNIDKCGKPHIRFLHPKNNFGCPVASCTRKVEKKGDLCGKKDDSHKNFKQ